MSFVVALRDFFVGSAMARVTRNRIYEKAGGKGKEVGRQIGHHRTAKHKRRPRDSEKTTRRCIAKGAPTLTDVPLGLEGEMGQRVHR